MKLSIKQDPLPLVADMDGVVRVGTTRITLDTIIAAFREGATPEEILQQYPSLRLSDIYSVIGYYLYHSAEVDHYLDKRQEIIKAVREQNEQRYQPEGVRERLLARTRDQGS